MLNFQFKNPTKILFGKGEITQLSNEIPSSKKVLILYGGGSIKKNGVYEQVKNALKNHEVFEFGGIPANPEYETLLKAIAFIKENKIDFLLAVGGGSVIDGTKFIAAAVNYNGQPWEILQNAVRTMEGEGLPFGTVLTLPATGSEMNSGYVISRRATNEKRASSGPGLFPQFSILDPEVIKSIPKRQIANGIADAYTHVLEQYMVVSSTSPLQERFAEGVLQTLQEIAPKVLEDNFDYESASNFMWCCTMALNGLLSQGVKTDWAVHAIGHELTAYFGIDHARTLAIIAPSHYQFNFESKKEKLAQYAERVWNITEGTLEEKAHKGIEKMEDFFHQLGIKTKLSNYVENHQNIADTIAQNFTERGWIGIGENKNITPPHVKEIVEMSY